MNSFISKFTLPRYSKQMLTQWLLWIIIFFIGRLVFYLTGFHFFQETGYREILQAFIKGFKLDLAAAAYISIIPWLIFFIYQWLPNKLWIKAVTLWNFVVFSLYAVLITAEIPLYKEWQTKANYKAITYLDRLGEGISSLTTLHTIVLILFCLALIIFFYYLQHKLLRQKKTGTKKTKWTVIAEWVLWLILIPITGRGGLQQIPLQVSDAFFSKNMHINYLAVNSFWHLGSSILENMEISGKNPYTYLPPGKAHTIVSELYKNKGKSPDILNTHQPNIVLIILEGWSADLIEPLGGYPGVTPNFNRLAKEGILFYKCYASGDRSDQGITAILSGFPAQPVTSIISQPSKYHGLPDFLKSLKKKNYYGSFMFGGQLSYGNIKSYLYSVPWDTILDIESFPAEWATSKLGIPDEIMFREFLHHTGQLPQPFVSAFFNLSSHAPYDIPRPYIHHWGTYEDGYVNGVWYADSCLGEFFKAAKQQKWYDQTLFVIVSDHGHNSPKNHPFVVPEYRKIPFLIYGPTIKSDWQGKMIFKTVSQTDVAFTILNQLGLKDTSFKWSRDVLDTINPGFAFYTFPSGFGWVEDSGYVVYDHVLQKITYNHAKDSAHLNEMTLKGKAYLQTLFDTYLSY